MTLATKLCELFREYDFRDDEGEAFKLTASFGLATYPEDAKSKDDLIRLARITSYNVCYTKLLRSPAHAPRYYNYEEHRSDTLVVHQHLQTHLFSA